MGGRGEGGEGGGGVEREREVRARERIFSDSVVHCSELVGGGERGGSYGDLQASKAVLLSLTSERSWKKTEA